MLHVVTFIGPLKWLRAEETQGSRCLDPLPGRPCPAVCAMPSETFKQRCTSEQSGRRSTYLSAASDQNPRSLDSDCPNLILGEHNTVIFLFQSEQQLGAGKRSKQMLLSTSDAKHRGVSSFQSGRSGASDAMSHSNLTTSLEDSNSCNCAVCSPPGAQGP